jgi:hypothetical protein
MSAPKRTGLLAARQATSDVPQSFQSRVCQYAGAEAAFEKVTKQGFEEELLWRWLWDMARLKLAQAHTKRQWYALPGITPKTLRRFPNRVRGMADEIEKLNAKMQSDSVHRDVAEFLLPAIVKTALGTPFDFDIRRLNGLPFLLRLYAGYVEAVDRLVPESARRVVGEISALPIELLETSKSLTHKHFAVEIATLLTAAYHAVGSKSEVDPCALKMRYFRRSRKK